MFEYQLWTQWNFALFILYFLLSSAISGGSIIYKRPEISSDKADGLGRFVLILFQICFLEIFVVDITYWSILVPGYYLLEHKLPLINFWTFNHHGVNALWMIAEFIMNRNPIVLNHIWVVMLWPAAYIIFTLMVFPVSQSWPYPILNAWLPLGVMWYSVFFVGNMLVFCGCYLLHKLKMRCFGAADWDGSGDPAAGTPTEHGEETPIFSDF